MNLSQSGDMSHEFDRLTRVVFYVIFLINFLSMGLSQSYDLNCEFNWLILIAFLSFFFLISSFNIDLIEN